MRGCSDLSIISLTIGMLEENVEFHVTLSVELPRTVRTVVADWKTFPPTPGPESLHVT